MSQKRNVPFKISGMDSLGQGVSKVSDKVTFIPKTVIGDEGEATITAEKKGVAFGQVKNLTHPSPLREAPPCPHYTTCPSCHYQHVSYENELKFKREALEKLFYGIKLPAIKVIGATKRLEYRNRVQLHYDRSKQKMGMLDIRNNEILPIPQCMIGLPQVNDEIKRLYFEDSWLKEAPQKPLQGHVELYWTVKEMKVSWNRPYAEGGFTQVFEEMNQRLKVELTSWLKSKPLNDLLDLFGGNGNLSNGLNYSKRLCVDLYKELPGGDFFSQDLYAPDALKNVRRILAQRDQGPTHLLLDPPRSGLKDLKLWLDTLKPQAVAYVSCDPHTLARDIKSIPEYEITAAFLIDFFPSTFHFESMLFLERKS